ncbi:MerR family transcriptional regulator, partial [Candidatus Pacearchaeota archaeon]
TLRYWEQSGKLPKPVRRGRRVYHNEDVLPMVRLLAATRPQRIQKIRQSVVPSMGRIVRMSQDGDVLTVVIRKGKNIEQTQTN